MWAVAASTAVYAGMTKADPDAIWLMQGWLFINEWWTEEHPGAVSAYLSGVPRGKMWIRFRNYPAPKCHRQSQHK